MCPRYEPPLAFSIILNEFFFCFLNFHSCTEFETFLSQNLVTVCLPITWYEFSRIVADSLWLYVLALAQPNELPILNPLTIAHLQSKIWKRNLFLFSTGLPFVDAEKIKTIIPRILRTFFVSLVLLLENYRFPMPTSWHQEKVDLWKRPNKLEFFWEMSFLSWFQYMYELLEIHVMSKRTQR